MNYVTLYQVKEQLKLSSITTDDSIFNNWITWSSELIDWWKGRRFDVYQDTIRLDAPKQTNSKLGEYYFGEQTAVEQLFQKELYLKTSQYDLLSIIELLNGDGEEILASQYLTEPANRQYINRVWIKRSTGKIWLPDNDNEFQQAIELTGWFGYNKRYPNCFVDTLEVIATGGINASVTTIVLANAAGLSADRIAPRVQAGQMLKIEDELMYVISVATNNLSCEVERAFNGTTAAAHIATKKIYVYRPDGDIVQMALRLVQWRYRQKDQDTFDRTYNLATSMVTSPTSLPADVRMILGTRRADVL